MDILLFIYIFVVFVPSCYSWSMNPYCNLYECCNKDWIINDINSLRSTLKLRVYGQHLVDHAADAIAAHVSPNYKAQKALTLSFHGWSGSGKNYVSRFIAESLYKAGTKSKYVHHISGRIHFTEHRLTNVYQSSLYSWLKGNTTDCPYQLFIFDEVDKMPPAVLNGIKPLIDYRNVVDGVDYTKAIFVFLSNTGSLVINNHYESLYVSGRRREDLLLSDFEKIIIVGVFNEEGGFHYADPIKANLIDHYIPFLPMHEHHIIMCIKDEFRLRGINAPKEEHIKEVLDFVEWGPDHNKLFAKTGCKRISQKVGVTVAKYYYDTLNNGKREL